MKLIRNLFSVLLGQRLLEIEERIMRIRNLRKAEAE